MGAGRATPSAIDDRMRYWDDRESMQTTCVWIASTEAGPSRPKPLQGGTGQEAASDGAFKPKMNESCRTVTCTGQVIGLRWQARIRYPYQSSIAVGDGQRVPIKYRRIMSGCYLALWPVPVRATVCGLPPPPSEIETSAVRVPVAVGVNVTVMLQLAPAATLG